ncbi:MAG: MFS transporter [Phycisphaerae bacterium]
MSLTSDPSAGPHDPYAALRVRDFRLFLSGAFLANCGMQMQTVAVGWEVYRRTHEALNLGLVGLVQFLPVFLLALPAGHLADHFERRRIVLMANLVIALSSLGLAAIVHWHGPTGLIYACLALTGTARAMAQPARAALVPQIVPRGAFSNAITWGSGGFQLAAVTGPAVGGLLVATFQGTAPVFLLDATATLTFVVLLAIMKRRSPRHAFETPTLRSLLEGLRFVLRTKIILATITLDLFAVLLGGAVMLLPIYATDLLKVGARGLGYMQAAPAAGAIMTSLLLTHLPPMRRAGRTLLLAVTGFGLATIVFGLSRSLPLSLAMLFLTGAFDMVSVVIRHTLVQTLTPDEMRGRVSAVNGIFIGASNELGGFESGLVAHWLGPTASVVLGGIGTLTVVGLVALGWPQVRRYGRLGGESRDEGGFLVIPVSQTPDQPPAAGRFPTPEHAPPP